MTETVQDDGMVKYQFEIDREEWEAWKETVPRTKSLDDRIRELIRADAEGRVSEPREPAATDEADTGGTDRTPAPTELDLADAMDEEDLFSDGEWADLKEEFEEYLTDRPPKTSHGKQAVLVTLEVLREKGAMSTGELQELVFDRLESDAYDKPRGMWQSIQRYMGDVDEGKSYDAIPGIVKSGYGEWGYAGDDELRRELKALNDE